MTDINITSSFTWSVDRDGMIAMQGSRDGESGWACSFPSDGSDPTWIEDDEQPYENWRYYHTVDGWWTLLVKHDGCIELRHAANTPFFIDGRALTVEERDRVNHDCDDEIHICDAQRYLALIQSAARLPGVERSGTIKFGESTHLTGTTS